MKKIFGIIAACFIGTAVLYINYRAIKESKPFLINCKDWFVSTWMWRWPTNSINWFANLKVVKKPVESVKNQGGKLIHMFDRKKAEKAEEVS